MSAPTVTLNNGIQMPILGLGTLLAKNNQGEQAVMDAIDAGYRHFDTAYIYGNESEVGRACNAKISEGIIRREDLFIVTKLWNTFHAPENIPQALQISLNNLKLGYIDLYLMHSPTAYEFRGFDGHQHPRDDEGNLCFDDRDYVDTWHAMEKLVKSGKVKSIGVSNFNSEQIRRICESGTIRPAVNQVECNPRLNQKKLIEVCRRYGIVVTAFRPFENFSPNSVNALLLNQDVIRIGKKYNKTAGQVILKYLTQSLGVAAIPRSINKERIRQNIDIFDFTLSPGDIHYLDSLNCNSRTCQLSASANHKYFPFRIDY